MTNPVRHAPADKGASAMAAWKTLSAADADIHPGTAMHKHTGRHWYAEPFWAAQQREDRR
jgi:hypothetical protein